MLVLILSSTSKKTLNLYSLFLEHLFKKLHIKYLCINLPIRTNKITLLKSPHVNKKAKEQFEICHFKARFFINTNMDFKIIKYLILNKPKSLNLKLKFLER